MRAGQLDKRVKVERLQGGPAEQPGTWAHLFDCWAAVEPLTERELLTAMAARSEATHRIRMRFRPWMTAEDRVIHDGTIYNIVSVIDVRSEHRELHLMCKAIG